MEDNYFDTFNTIDEINYSLYDTNESSKIKIKDLIINKNINKMEIQKINKLIDIDNLDNNNTNNLEKSNSKEIKYEDKILMQRENRKTMAEIKSVISKRQNNNLDMTKLLIKNILNNYKRDISLLYDDKNNTLLHIYVNKNDINSLELILSIYINELNYSEKFYNFLFSQNIENKTIFDIVIEKNYISIVKLLYAQIENGTNFQEKKKYMNYLKNTVFHKCAEYNQCYMVIFFYEKIKNFYRFFTLDQISNNNSKEHMNPLHIASNKKHKSVIKLLIDLGGDVNSQDINGYTPLHYAVMTRNENMTKRLILRGANKLIKDKKNRTPYDLALSMNDKDLVDILYHKKFCKRIFCGGEIEPLTKTKNHYFLLISILFNIIIKFIIIFRFICIFNNINFDIFSFNRKLSSNVEYKLNFNHNGINNYKSNQTELYNLNLNNYFNCVDNSCNIEVIVIFSSLITDIFLLLIIIIFKCSRNIFLKRKTEKEVESLSDFFENNNKICIKCRIAINNSTKHCLICNRCVNNWDHHCYWLNTCINDKNYKKFKFFLFSILLFLISEFLFYSNTLYLFYNTKKLFVKKVLNIENETFLYYIIKIILFTINIHLVIIILYSLIFIAIPIIKNYCHSSNNDFEDKSKHDLFMNIIDDKNIINTNDNYIKE